MSEQTIELGDIIGLEIPVDGKWTCLAKTQQQERCQHPVATRKRDDARVILQHKMTFRESEHDLIRSHIRTLVDILFLKSNHNDIESQKSERETIWLGLWLTELEEHSGVRQRHESHESHDSAIAINEPEQSEPVAMIPEHEPHEIAHIPTLVRYPTLPLEPTPVPTNAPVRTTTIPSYLNRTITLDTMEDVSDQMAEVATISQPSVSGHDAPLALNQTSSLENVGLSVFFSSNQLELINVILQFGLQLCAFFQIQYGTFICRDGSGNKRTESFLQFKLIFGVRSTLSGILTSPWVMFPLVVALGQLMYIIMGPWLSLMLFLFVALVGSCWPETKTKAIVGRTEIA